MNQNNEAPVQVYDVLASDTDSNGKTRWNTIGVAFPLKNGGSGFSMRLHMFDKWFVLKETLRAVGASKAHAENAAKEKLDSGSTPAEDTPF